MSTWTNPDANPDDIYRIGARCVATVSGADVVTATYEEIAYDITGPAPTLTLAPATVAPGGTVRVTPSAPCPAGAPNRVNVGMQNTTEPDISFLVGIVVVDSAGSWSTAVDLAALGRAVPTGTYRVWAWCDVNNSGGQGQVPGRMYADAALTIAAPA